MHHQQRCCTHSRHVIAHARSPHPLPKTEAAPKTRLPPQSAERTNTPAHILAHATQPPAISKIFTVTISGTRAHSRSRPSSCAPPSPFSKIGHRPKLDANNNPHQRAHTHPRPSPGLCAASPATSKQLRHHLRLDCRHKQRHMRTHTHPRPYSRATDPNDSQQMLTPPKTRQPPQAAGHAHAHTPGCVHQHIPTRTHTNQYLFFACVCFEVARRGVYATRWCRGLAQQHQ